MAKVIFSLLIYFLSLPSGASQGINFFPEYEILPETNDGSNQIGLSETGNPFEFHERENSVETIDVWTEGNSIAFIQIKMFGSGTIFKAGKQPLSSPTSFRFEQGERLTGFMTLTANGEDPNFLGSIRFKTTKNRDFFVGRDSDRNKFLFPSGESFLMGFHGDSGDLIDSLGFYMMKPLKKLEVLVDDYDFTELENDPPRRISRGELPNNTPAPISSTLTEKQLKTVSSSFTSELSFSLTVGVSVKAGLPAVAEVNKEIKFTIGASFTWVNAESKTEESSQAVTVIAVPCKLTRYENSWIESTAPVGFTGRTQYQFEDDTFAEFPLTGVWTGVITSTILTSTTVEALLDPSDECKAILGSPGPTPAPLFVVPTIAPGLPSLPSLAPTTAPLFVVPTIAPEFPSLPSLAPTTAPLFVVPTIAPGLPSLPSLAPTTAPLFVVPTPSPQGPFPEITFPGVYITNARDVYITLCSGHHPELKPSSDAPSTPPPVVPEKHPELNPTPSPVVPEKRPEVKPTPSPAVPEKDEVPTTSRDGGSEAHEESHKSGKKSSKAGKKGGKKTGKKGLRA